MAKFNEEMVKAGVMPNGNGLQPSSKGARVRFSGDKRRVYRRPIRGDQGTGSGLLAPSQAGRTDCREALVR
jgi:hypothetical protein